MLATSSSGSIQLYQNHHEKVLVKTGPDGRFEFGDVFLHDTDRIQIKVESEGHETGQWDSVDRYCLLCNCFREPLEIVLRIVPGP